MTSKFISSNKKGRNLVIPDIHGCLDTFLALLEKVNFKENDYLFLLGDYINRGKNSKGVLDKIIDLQEGSTYRVFALRGNHEQMLIDDYRNNEFQNSELAKEKYYNFAISLPHYFELEHHFLVHAGFNKQENTLSDTQKMLWLRDFTCSEKEKTTIFKNKNIITGHNPTFLDTILEDIENRNPLICLDNGCVYSQKWFLGNLLCLDLSSYETFVQKNID